MLMLINCNEVFAVEHIREKLEELIMLKGTMDNEVLLLSQNLDEYIVNYYKNQLGLNLGQAVEA